MFPPPAPVVDTGTTQSSELQWPAPKTGHHSSAGPQQAVQQQPLTETTAALEQTGGHTFTVSMSGAPVVLDIKVQAVPACFITTQEPDSRSSTPSPDNWLVDPDEAALTWELFNCVVLTVWPRSSTP